MRRRILVNTNPCLRIRPAPTHVTHITHKLQISLQIHICIFPEDANAFLAYEKSQDLKILNHSDGLKTSVTREKQVEEGSPQPPLIKPLSNRDTQAGTFNHSVSSQFMFVVS